MTGNDGTVRIQVPVEFLQMSQDEASDGPEDRFAPDLLIKALETQLEGMKDLVDSERRRADTEGLRADAEGKRAEAEGRRADAAEADRDAWRQQAQQSQRGFFRRMFG